MNNYFYPHSYEENFQKLVILLAIQHIKKISPLIKVTVARFGFIVYMYV